MHVMSRQPFPLQLCEILPNRRVGQLIEGVCVMLFAPRRNEPEPVTVKAQRARREPSGLTVKQEKSVSVG